MLNGEKLTNAALLYSDQNPVVGSFISCTRWDGLDKLSAKDDIEFYGSILDQKMQKLLCPKIIEISIIL